MGISLISLGNGATYWIVFLKRAKANFVQLKPTITCHCIFKTKEYVQLKKY